MPNRDLISEPLATSHFSPSELEAMKQAWDQGAVVRVCLPVSIKPKGQAEQQGEVKLYLRREDDADRSRETCVRGRVTVIGKKPDLGKFSGLFIADDGIVSQFLGDAEPPAHDRWLQYKTKEHYDKPEKAFRRLVFAMKNLYGILAEAEENTPIRDALIQYFWVPHDREKGTTPDLPPLPKLPEPASKSFRVGQIDGGFVFARKRTGDPSKKESYVVNLCYDTRHGKPKWDPADFLLTSGEIRFRKKGNGEVQAMEDHGEIRILDAEPGFELRVTGFDPRRDLLIEAKEIGRGQ